MIRQPFDLVAGVSSPRYVLFDSCSFKEIRRVLSAPGNMKGAYHNYKFRYCSFTVYGTDVLFEGRIIWIRSWKKYRRS
ncbi:hypothetical protein PAAL109150_12285 [Paenibacillus alkaliterrae]